jgi:hypothetical protein
MENEQVAFLVSAIMIRSCMLSGLPFGHGHLGYRSSHDSLLNAGLNSLDSI